VDEKHEGHEVGKGFGQARKQRAHCFEYKDDEVEESNGRENPVRRRQWADGCLKLAHSTAARDHSKLGGCLIDVARKNGGLLFWQRHIQIATT